MGLFDFDLSPQRMGLLGMAGNMSQAYAPQPASRLPLARPNVAYLLGQAASGLGEGYKTGKAMQGLEAQTQGMQIKNLNDALSYNLWAPYLGLKPLQLGGSAATGTGLTPVTAPAIQAAGPQGAGPPAGGGVMPSASAAGGAVPPGLAGAPPMSGASPMPGIGPSGPGASPIGVSPQGQQAAQLAAAGPTPAGGDMRSLYQLPPPLLQKMGIPVPPELTTLYMQGIGPGDPRYTNALNTIAIKGMGVNPVIGGERPGVPAQNFNLSTMRYEPQPGTFDTMAKGAFTQAQASGQGGLASKEAEAAFNAGLKVTSENEIAKRQAFYQTGVMPPDYSNAQQPQMPAAVSSQGIVSPRGTVVPPPQPAPFPGTDAMVKQNANTADREKDFGNVRSTLDQTEARAVALANALKVVQSGGTTERRAEIANILQGAGLPTDWIMNAKDTAAVQTALGVQTLEVLGQLKNINQGTGGRILNSEFTNLLDRQYGPDLKPEANFNLLTQALGGIYQTRNMIDDYYAYGKPAGWRDANAYQSAYYSNPHNSMQTMIDQAGKAIGPLKGMAPSPSKVPPPAAIQHLQMNPQLAPQFDDYYGPGSAAQYMKKP